MIHLLKVTGKLFDLLKSKSYLSSLEDIAHHATYVNALFTTSLVLSKASEQLLSYKLLSRTTKVKLNCKQVDFDWKSRMLWIWFCPISTRELLLKIAVPKRQTKSMKSNCKVVSFYYVCKLYTWNWLRTNFSQALHKDFAKAFLKDFADFPLYGIVKNLIIYFEEAFWYFSHYQFTTLLPFLSKFWISFFQRTPSSGCFSWYMSERNP